MLVYAVFVIEAALSFYRYDIYMLFRGANTVVKASTQSLYSRSRTSDVSDTRIRVSLEVRSDLHSWVALLSLL